MAHIRQLPNLTRIERPSVKDLTLNQLKNYIASGALAPGERLPSERVLAEQLGVGRNSLREALKVLEAIGVVESRIGEGTFITAQISATIGRTLGFKLAAWGGTIVELIVARQIFEVEAARAAAEHASPAEKEALRAELVRMETAVEFQAYLKADMQFHRLMARATHNAIVAHVIDELIEMLEQVLHEARGDEIPTRVESTGSHRSIYEAVQRGDGKAAAEAMRLHLQFSMELWQAIVSISAQPAPQDVTS